MSYIHQRVASAKWQLFVIKLPLCACILIFSEFVSAKETNETSNTEENIKTVKHQLETVIVTAERLETDVQKTPISITTFTSQEIQDLNITQIPDLGLRVPGLTLGKSSNFSTPDIYLRGVGTRDFTVGSDLSVGFYIDDVYIGRAGNIFIDLFELERIEILKGPQGTLWGRNAVAGAIHVVTAKPTDEFETRHQLTVGNFDLFRLSGTVSGPLVENTLLGNFSYSTRNREGYAINFFDGNDMGGVENISARGNLQYLPTNSLDVLLSFDYSKDRSTGIAFDSVITGAPANLLGHVEPPGPFRVNLDTPGQEHRDTYGISGKLTWESDILSFTSISAFRGYQLDLSDDTDGTSFKLANFINKIDQTQFTQEFRLSNKPTGDFKWLVGAFVFHEEAESQFTVDSSDFSLLLGPGDFLSTNFSSITSNSYSLFGQASYLMTNRLSMTLGGRYTHEEKNFDIQRSGNVIDGDFPLTKFDEDWQAFTPKVGVEFQQTNDRLWYASISRGFRSGGFNAGQSVLQKPFDPEFLTSYEIGLKSNWLNQRLQTNLAAFYYDHTDLQVTTVGTSLGGAPTLITDNAAGARNIGLEATILALPMQGLDINLSLAFLDTEYTDFTRGTDDFSGNSINHSPEFSSYLGVQYTFPVNDYGFIIFGAEHQYQSKIFLTEDNENILSQSGYHNVNARIGFETFDERFSISMFANNLTDEETVNAAVDLRAALGVVNYSVNSPRTYAIQFAYKY